RRCVDIDVFAHGAYRARVGADLDDGQDGVADDVALAGGKEVHGIARRSAQGHHFGGRRRRVHEPQAFAGRHFGLVEHAVDAAFLADLLDVAQRFFFDGGQAAGDIALGRLRFGQVAGFPAVDDFLVAIEHEHEALAHRIVGTAFGHDVFAAGQFGGLAEHQRIAQGIELVEGVAHGGVGAAARRGVRFAALGGHPQVGYGAFRALQRRGVVHELLGLARCAHDGVEVAVQFDAEAGHGLAGGCNAIDDALGPAFFDADDDDGRDVGVAARADQGAEMQFQIFAELQAAVGVRQGHGALDVVGDGFGGCVGDVIHGQDDDVVAHAYAPIIA